ncbi:hypothetical protein J7643_15250 [bacterium]|nr:hypothetical protein [bacterium]
MRGWRSLAAGVSLAALAGCAAPLAPTGLGVVQLYGDPGRRVQYRADQIGALKVTFSSSNAQALHSRVFGAEALRLSSGGATFAFEALHLPPGAYLARFDAYLDPGMAIAIGSATSSAFTVFPNQMSRVLIPPLTLSPTPVGQWRIRVVTSVGKGWQFGRLTADLAAPDGTTASLPSEVAKSNRTFTWENVPAPLGAISTTSVTVTATHGNQTLTRTQVATASLLADRRVTSTVSLELP